MSQFQGPQGPQYPPQQPFQQPVPAAPKKRKLGWLKATGVGVVTFFVGVGIGASGGETTTTAAAPGEPGPTVTVTQPAQPGEPAPTVTQTVPGPKVTQTVQVPGPKVTVTAKPPGPAVGIADDGTWLVGTDVKPGTYRSSAEGDCYWARLKNTNGDLDSIIANGNGGNQVVTIKSTDKAFESSNGCAPWTKVG
jgi:hypothetical protein